MSEADYMWQCQLSELGEKFNDPPPEFEVIRGKRMERLFAGSRAACWGFKRANGGFVRPYSGEASHDR